MNKEKNIISWGYFFTLLLVGVAPAVIGIYMDSILGTAIYGLLGFAIMLYAGFFSAVLNKLTKFEEEAKE